MIHTAGKKTVRIKLHPPQIPHGLELDTDLLRDGRPAINSIAHCTAVISVTQGKKSRKTRYVAELNPGFF